jgi:hypothetical protein
VCGIFLHTIPFALTEMEFGRLTLIAENVRNVIQEKRPITVGKRLRSHIPTDTRLHNKHFLFLSSSVDIP